MGWLYVGSVLIRERVNVSPGWSAHITTDDTPLPENTHILSSRPLVHSRATEHFRLTCVFHLFPHCRVKGHFIC